MGVARITVAVRTMNRKSTYIRRKTFRVLFSTRQKQRSIAHKREIGIQASNVNGAQPFIFKLKASDHSSLYHPSFALTAPTHPLNSCFTTCIFNLFYTTPARRFQTPLNPESFLRLDYLAFPAVTCGEPAVRVSRVEQGAERSDS